MNKMALLKLMVVGLAMLALAGSLQAQGSRNAEYQEGVHYFLIDGAPALPSETFLLEEAFSYLCTHCNTFDVYVESWKQRKPEYVEFRRIPVGFGRGSWEMYARGYVTAEFLNVADEAHLDLMARIWKEKNIIRNMDGLATFYSQYGVDKEKFLSTARSFAVDGKMRKDQSLVQTYGIQGTPSLVLNGKYRISGSAALGSYDAMFDVVDFLIEKERGSAQQASVSAE